MTTDNIPKMLQQASNSNRDLFLEVLNGVMHNGSVLAPRGQKIREIENAMIELNPIYPCMSFTDRKFNLEYAKKEWIWKLTGNRYDESIKDHAKAWADLADVDGGYNSNYGQYFFGKQNGFEWVVHELIRDKDSRRAVIPLLNADHLRTNNPDHVCTESISFRIRDDRLNMSVNMRSNDVIWGLTTDAITFCLLYRMVYVYLREFYPELGIGIYNHKADSLHIYERHWPMANAILQAGPDAYTAIEIPWPFGFQEVEILRATGGKMTLEQLSEYPIELPFYSWLVS